jgi:hypothetical protein
MDQSRGALEAAQSVIGFSAPISAGLSVYPPCTSLGRILCFQRFCRLVESITYGGSIRLRIPTPPASTTFYR